MTENVTPELVERMIAVIRGYAGNSCAMSFGPNKSRSLYAEACALCDEFPAPVDPDLIEARTIARAVMTDGDWSGLFEQQILAGAHDDSVAVRAALAALKSRTLATQGDR